MKLKGKENLTAGLVKAHPPSRLWIIWASSQVLSSFSAALKLLKSLFCWKTSSQLAECWHFRYLYFLWWAATTVRRYWCLWKSRHTSSGQHQHVSSALLLHTKFQIKAHQGLMTLLSVNVMALATIYGICKAWIASARLTQQPRPSGVVMHSPTRLRKSRAREDRERLWFNIQTSAQQAFPRLPGHGSGSPCCSSHTTPLAQQLGMLQF